MLESPTAEQLYPATYLNDQLSALEERLVGEYRSVDPETVRRHVHAERDQYADARVRVFVPILVERGVRARLAAS